MSASIKTPSMTNRLIDRLKADAEVTAAKINADVKVHLDWQKLQIVHNTYPTFLLQIDVPVRGLAVSDPVIHYLITTKKSASSEQKYPKPIEITLSCVGPDECYYHFGENDRATEHEVSEFLLKPPFAGIIR